MVIFLITTLDLSAQKILSENHIYGCENCIVTHFQVIGQNKVLFDFTKSNKRKIILLDKQNLQVDEMRVGAPTEISQIGMNRFSVAELGAVVEVSIKAQKFIVDQYISFRHSLSSLYGLRYPVSNQNYAIGQGSHNPNGSPDYFSYFSYNQETGLAYLKGHKSDGYKLQGKDMKILSGKVPINQSLNTIQFINRDQQLKTKINSQPATWVSYAIHGDLVTIFSGHLQQLYKVKIDQLNDRPRMVSTFDLPKEKRAPDGWYYFSDYIKQIDYFLLPAAEGQEQHELMALQGEKLKKVASLAFIPVDIEDGVIYQLKQKDNGCDIYGYPLEKKEQLLRYDINN